MVRVIVFHHAQGLTSGVASFADRLRLAGHEVHTPDLFDGQTFDSIDAGIAHVNTAGFNDFIKRGEDAAREIGGSAVYVGFSLGVLPAQKLAQTLPDARGALLCYSCVPVSEFGDSWPLDVPLQIHAMDADPYFVDDGDIDAARSIVDSAPDAELFLYAGDQHYFADDSLPSYDAVATALLMKRVLKFLADLDGSPNT